MSLNSVKTLLLTVVVDSIRSNFLRDEDFFITQRRLFAGQEGNDNTAQLWIRGPLDAWNQEVKIKLHM